MNAWTGNHRRLRRDLQAAPIAWGKMIAFILFVSSVVYGWYLMILDIAKRIW